MPGKRVVLGRVNGLFGVRGWIKVYSHTRPIDNLIDYPRWFLGTFGEERRVDWRSFSVVAARPHGKTLVAQLADDGGRVIDDRDEALGLVESDIAVARADMPELPAGEYYWHDLVGLEVINRDAVVLGRVHAMMETGANDVLVVEGERQRLIPFVLGVFVDHVDLEAGHMRVDWEPEF